MAKNNNTLVFNGLMQGMSWDQIKEAKDEIKRHQGEKPPTRKDILTDWIVGKDYMLQQQGEQYRKGGHLFYGDPYSIINNSMDKGFQQAEDYQNFLERTSDNNTGNNTNNNTSDNNNSSQNTIDFGFGMFEGINNVVAPVVGGIANSLNYNDDWGSNSAINKAAYGDSTSDPILRSIEDISGTGLKRAKDEIQNRRQGNILNLNYGDNASLMAQIDAYNKSKVGRFSKLGDLTVGGGIVDFLNSAGQGALHGSTFAPGWGTLIGAAAGSLAWMGNAITESKNREKLNRLIEDANNDLIRNDQRIAYTASNNQLLNTFNQLQHMTSKGGKLNKAHRFAEGGLLNTYDYGLEEVNAGGSHEENPNEGVIVSYAPDGLPNKVEEGETIHNDYVYSKRLEANEKVLKNNLLDKKYEGKSFADISKKLTEDRKKRPNDPISVRTNEENLDRLQGAQEELKLDNKTREVKRFLGSLNNDQLNALQQEMMDEYEAYAEQLAQQQEQEDQIYQEEQAAQEGMFGRGGHLKQGTYGSSYLEREPWYTEPTIVSTWSNPLNVENKIFELSNPTNQEQYGIYERNAEGEIKKSKDGKPIIKKEYKKPEENSYSSLAPLRFAEAFGSAGQYLSDILGLTNQPDYSNARMYQRAIDNIGGVNFTPIGNYLTYTPIDTEYLTNQQMATAAARRNYNNVVGNYTLGLLGNYNTLNQIGATAIAARQQDQEQKSKVAEFNRATNDRNSTMSLDAQKQNAALRAQRAQEYRYLADMMTKERDINEAARAANYQNFMSNLAAIGREDFNYDQIKWMIDHGVFPVGAESYLTGLKI